MRSWTLILVLALILPADGQDEAIDAKKATEIRAKQRRGETLKPEEEAYLEKWQEERRRQLEAWKREHPPRPSTGMVPLSELATGKHEGSEGGLYPGGRNVPPDEHLNAGLEMARTVVPLDLEGKRSESGKIVLLSIGMSNTTQEFQFFMRFAEADPNVNSLVVIVDGAQGGQSADRTAAPDAKFWRVVDERLTEAGASRNQVQVAWIKQATPRPERPFPEEANRLKAHLATNLQIMVERFPNLKLCYLSNRIYAGYAESPLNPEPHAYETGFAVKWLIQDQIEGSADLNHDPAKGTVKSPWLAWGPDLWADGVRSRRDGLTYLREDLGKDGTHPSDSGKAKVGRLLLEFLKSEPTARMWFLTNAEPG